MDDPRELKEGDVVLIKQGDYPGIGLVMKIGENEGDYTRVTYRRLIGSDLRPAQETKDHTIKLRYVNKLDRRQVAKMFEAIRNDLNEAERIVSDAMFEGKSYVRATKERA